MPVFLILSTCPDADTAQRLARTLVDERLAACVNLLPGVVSTYHWQGQVEQATEVQLLAKITADRRDALMARLAELHPYELPEILGGRNRRRPARLSGLGGRGNPGRRPRPRVTR